MVKSFYKSHIRKKYGETNRLSKMENEIRRVEFLPMVKKPIDTVGHQVLIELDKSSISRLNKRLNFIFMFIAILFLILVIGIVFSTYTFRNEI